MNITVERSDTEFGRYVHAAWSDERDALLPTVRIWYFEGTLAHALERHYPDGRCEIIVQLGTPHAPEHPTGSERFPPVCTSGVATRQFAVVAPTGVCRVVGLMLDPATLSAALDAPLAGMNDLTLDLHAIIGAAASELGERCAGARTPDGIIRAALNWLRERVVRGRRFDAAVQHALARLRASRGVVSIAALQAETVVAGPRLARRFAQLVGTTPKRYARILRFHHALELIRYGRQPDLAAVAAGAGYFDQAHMYVDFNEFCDRTPAAFARALHYPQGISIAEHENTGGFSKTA